MKRMLFLPTLFCLILIGNAQISINMGNAKPAKQEVIDTAIIQVSYEMVSVQDTTKADKTTKDNLVLEIGQTGISKFYSDNTRRMDSLMADVAKRGVSTINFRQMMEDNGISSRGDERVIFKNYPTGKITVTDRILSTDYLYEDELNGIQWEILPDTMTSLSYRCQKATADFRGRHYEAWFAPDFPINDGPWKFQGLPGLILQIEDSQKHFSFRATGIEKLKKPIHYGKKDYLKTSRQEVDKVKCRFIENPMEFIKNTFPGANIQIKMKNDDGSESVNSEVKFPYNPIEKN